MQVIFPEVCCLCYGAKRSLDLAEKVANNNANVVMFKELLHNKKTLTKMFSLGVVIKNELAQIARNDYVIVPAHGEGKATFEYFKENKIQYIDCTCPNVKAINELVEKKSYEGYKIIIVGKYGKNSKKMHQEVLATSNWCKEKPLYIQDLEDIDKLDMSFEKYFLVVQTTFSYLLFEQILMKLKNIFGQTNKVFDYKDTTCSAQRQVNVSSVELAKQVDLMLVVGSKNSSNTEELFKNISNYCKAYFVESLEEVVRLSDIFNKNDRVGLTGGASTRIDDLNEIKNYLLERYNNVQ